MEVITCFSADYLKKKKKNNNNNNNNNNKKLVLAKIGTRSLKCLANSYGPKLGLSHSGWIVTRRIGRDISNSGWPHV